MTNDSTYIADLAYVSDFGPVVPEMLELELDDREEVFVFRASGSPLVEAASKNWQKIARKQLFPRENCILQRRSQNFPLLPKSFHTHYT